MLLFFALLPLSLPAIIPPLGTREARWRREKVRRLRAASLSRGRVYTALSRGRVYTALSYGRVYTALSHGRVYKALSWQANHGNRTIPWGRGRHGGGANKCAACVPSASLVAEFTRPYRGRLITGIAQSLGDAGSTVAARISAPPACRQPLLWPSSHGLIVAGESRESHNPLGTREARWRRE